MDVKINEFKKVTASPVIIGFLVICIIFNFFIIFQHRYVNTNIKVLNNIVSKFGYKINNQMMKEFKGYYEHGLKNINEIFYKNTSKKYENVSQCLNDLDYKYSSSYSKDQIEFLNKMVIEESYYFNAKNIDEIYKEINPIDIAEGQIRVFNLKGKTADTVRKEYKKFNERFKKMIKNKEHKNLFFMGKANKMHSLLFGTLFKNFIFEIIILVALSTSYLVNFEFNSNTHLLCYTSLKGRNLIRDKLITSIFTNLLLATVIIVTGLIAYFITFDYSQVWNVPISSYFNMEHSLPYMSWWNMSFVQYLFCCMVLMYICILIFNGITFVIARFVRNNYIVFFISSIIFGLAVIIPSFISTSNNFIFVCGFTPFFLVLNSLIWFMEGGAFFTFKYYEIITVSVWNLIIFSLSVFSIKSFKKTDIV